MLCTKDLHPLWRLRGGNEATFKEAFIDFSVAEECGWSRKATQCLLLFTIVAPLLKSHFPSRKHGGRCVVFLSPNLFSVFPDLRGACQYKFFQCSIVLLGELKTGFRALMYAPAWSTASGSSPSV